MPRLPELMGSAEARAAIPSELPRPARRRDLACDTVYLAADVRDLAEHGAIQERRRMPKLMGAKEAAAALSVKRPNLYAVSGIDAVPQQQTPRGTVYLASGILGLKAERESPDPPRVCARHGDEDMRVGKSGKRWCAACARERKKSLLSDSVRRERYNARRRSLYRKQQETEAAA